MIVYLMQIITIIVNIYISFTEKKKRIYIATFMLNLAQLVMYFFNKDLTTALIYIIITFRSFVYIYKDAFKSKILPFIFIAVQLGIGIFTIERPIQILSILIPCYTCYYLWFYNTTQKLRIGNIIANGAWGIYNLCNGLYIILIMRIMTVISNLVAYIKRSIEIKKWRKKMVDLHTHTNHSDGTDSVEELLEKAEESKVEILAITDHDQVGAYIELEKNPDIRKKFSGKILPGVELKTHYNGTSIEVLGYGIDYKLLKINALSDEELQKNYLKKMKSVLDEYGFKYDNEELYIDFNNPKKHWASYTIASEVLKYKENDELIKKVGEFDTTSFYRVHQSNKNSVFYVDESENYEDINKIIENIHNAHGLAFLAHGYIYPFENKDSAIEEILSKTNIDGIECQHPSFTEEEKKKAVALANKYHKYKSGGTDYHAKNKPDINLVTGKNGNVHVTYEFIEDWIDKCKTI